MQVVSDLLEKGCRVVPGQIIFNDRYDNPITDYEECIAIMGTWPQCMSILAFVINELAESLISLSCEKDDVLLHSAEHDFNASIEMLLSFKQIKINLTTILYWPHLQMRHTFYGELHIDPDTL